MEGDRQNIDGRIYVASLWLQLFAILSLAWAITKRMRKRTRRTTQQ